MQQSSVEVRTSEAQRAHIPFVAWVILMAFRSHLERGLWDFFVDGSEAECLRFLEALAGTKTRHWEHYANFVVAEVDGKPVSALSGYFESECGGPALGQGVREAGQALGRSEEEDAAGWQRAGSIGHCAPEHAPGAWIVENVATLPEFRKQGLVDQLLGEILDKGRARGAAVAEVGVLIGNDPAQRAYEKAGFAVVDEKCHPEFEDVYKSPGIRLLRRTI